MNKRFTDVKVSSHINCSSSFDYFVPVHFSDNGKRKTLHFWINGDELLGKRGYRLEIPVYFHDAIRRELLKTLNAGVKVYEYDRDGNERYENLRYHEPDNIQRWIEALDSYFETAQVRAADGVE